MKTLKFIRTLFITSFITSCHINHSLSDDDHKWMPYIGNEILVFTSNTGMKDTIFFLKKDTLIAIPNAPNPFGTTYQEVAIFCKHSDPAPPDGQRRYLENYFCKLGKSEDKKARLNFSLYAENATFYKLSGVRIDSLSNQPPTELQTKYKTYHDIYIIEDEDWLNFKERSDYVTKLYWSKSEGLIRYDKQNNLYWELEKRYSR